MDHSRYCIIASMGRRGLTGIIYADTQRQIEFDQKMATVLDKLDRTLTKQQVYLDSVLEYGVQTLDTVLFEHQTIPLPTTKKVASITLQAQTSQTEVITALYVSIVVPDISTAPAITIENAWAKLGDNYFNLFSLLNSVGGSGGTLPNMPALILREGSSRELLIVAKTNYPSTAYLTFILSGMPIPATLGGVLH